MSEIRPLHLVPEEPLTDSTKLWRYVPLRTLFLYLSGKLFIPSVETLRKGDPFEAQFYLGDRLHAFSTALVAWYGSWEPVLKWIFESRLKDWQQRAVRPDPAGLIDYNQSFFERAYFEFMRATRYAWCWFAPAIEWESAAMWNIYGKDGAAVITTVSRLRDVLGRTSHDFEFGRMRYVHADETGIVVNTYPGSIRDDPEAILRPHFLKRAEYQSEQEVRFVTADCERGSGGISIDLPPQEWIEKIWLWPGLSSSETTALQEIISTRLFRVPCNRSGMLKSAPDEEMAARIAEFVETPWRAGDDADGIPSELKRLWSSKPTPAAPSP